MLNTEKCLDLLLKDGYAQNFAVFVGKKDKTVAEIYKSNSRKTDEFTLFDMASVTKILATTMLSLTAIENGKLNLDDKLSRFFNCNADKADITVQNLLTHTMGLGHKNLCKDGFNYGNIADYILSLPLDIPVDSDVLYSCPAFVLLGKIIEKLYGERLDLLFNDLIAKPLGMNYTGYLPNSSDIVNSNLSADDNGTVNDYNCRYLGGIAGNAGIFSNIHDMKIFVNMLLNRGTPLINRKTFDMAVKNHTKNKSESRGLGFVYVDKRFSQTGNLFKEGSIGHCGHTGQSVFVDLDSGLFVIILSDMTVSTVKKLGSEDYNAVMKARQNIHNSILKDLTM